MQVQKAKRGYKLVQDFFKRQIEIPENWEYPKFSGVVKVNPITKSSSKRCPYIPMDAVDTQKPPVNYFEERPLDENSSLPKFQENDVLFARITPSTENGKTALIENFQGVGIASSELTVLRPTEKVIPRYLYYYVKNERIRNFAVSQMMGTTNRQRVPDYVFKKDLNFELPPIQEQQKIASILSNVDSLINQTQKEIEQTQRLKKGLMQRLLTKGIGHKKFKKVIYRFGRVEEIPDRWEIKTLKEISENLVGGGTPSTTKSEYWNGDIHWTKSATLNSRYLTNGEQFITRLGLKNSSASIVPKDNLLIASRVSMGNITINKIDVAINQDITGIVVNKKITSEEYLYWMLLDDINRITSLSQGTTIQGFTRRELSKLKLPIPPLKEQQKIASILSNVDSQIQKQQEYKSHLEFLKKGLMQKLLTGKIRVKV